MKSINFKEEDKSDSVEVTEPKEFLKISLKFWRSQNKLPEPDEDSKIPSSKAQPLRLCKFQSIPIKDYHSDGSSSGNACSRPSSSSKFSQLTTRSLPDQEHESSSSLNVNSYENCQEESHKKFTFLKKINNFFHHSKKLISDAPTTKQNSSRTSISTSSISEVSRSNLSIVENTSPKIKSCSLSKDLDKFEGENIKSKRPICKEISYQNEYHAIVDFLCNPTLAPVPINTTREIFKKFEE